MISSAKKLYTICSPTTCTNHISTKEMKKIIKFLIFFEKKCEKPPFYEFQNFSKCGERGVIMVFIRAKCGFFSSEVVFFRF